MFLNINYIPQYLSIIWSTEQRITLKSDDVTLTIRAKYIENRKTYFIHFLKLPNDTLLRHLINIVFITQQQTRFNEIKII